MKKAWAANKVKKEPTEFIPGVAMHAENAIEEKISAQSRTMHEKYRWRAWYISVLKKTAVVLQHKLKMERRREADTIVEQARECDSPQKRTELYERTKGMRGSTARRKPRIYNRPLPKYTMANGEKAVTKAEKEEDLMQYFESIEGGQRTKEADIAARQAEGRNKQIQKRPCQTLTTDASQLW